MPVCAREWGSWGRSGRAKPPDAGANAPSTRAHQIPAVVEATALFHRAGSTGETRAAAPTTSATCSQPSTSADASAWQSHDNCRG